MKLVVKGELLFQVLVGHYFQISNKKTAGKGGEVISKAGAVCFLMTMTAAAHLTGATRNQRNIAEAGKR